MSTDEQVPERALTNGERVWMDEWRDRCDADPRLMRHEGYVELFEGILTFRIGTARAALLDSLARELPELTEGAGREGTAAWPERDRDIYSQAIEEAQAAIRTRPVGGGDDE